MVSVLAFSALVRGFEPWSGQNKDYKIGICCFSAKTTDLKGGIVVWLIIRIMCQNGATYPTCRLLCQ